MDEVPLSEPVEDRGPVEWFAGRLWPVEGLPRVGQWIPEGFERYARLLHPAYERERHGRVSWSRVAEWSGQDLHPTVLFDDLATRRDGTRWSSVGSGPVEGRLGQDIVARLGDVLADHTSTPQASWYAVWSGHGGLDLFEDRAVELTPPISASGRRYLLFRVPVPAAKERRVLTEGHYLVRRRAWMRVVPRRFWEPTHHRGEFYSPSFWWPEDRAWFVSTEVVAKSTYIGGSADLIERLKADPELEVLSATLEDPFDGVHPGMRTFE